MIFCVRSIILIVTWLAIASTVAHAQSTDTLAVTAAGSDELMADDLLEERAAARRAELEPRAWAGGVACFQRLTRREFADVTAVGARNKFDQVDQDVISTSATWSKCMSRRTRLHLEGSLAFVDEEGRKARAGLFGVGLMAELTPNITLTPLLRVGFERFGSGLRNTVFNGAMVAQAGFRLSKSPQAAELHFVLLPELTSRRTASTVSQGGASSKSSFANLASAGIDFVVGDRARGKVDLSTQYFSGATSTSFVQSATFSARLLTRDRETYTWNGQVSVSRGDGRYRRVLVGIGYRFNGKV